MIPDRDIVLNYIQRENMHYITVYCHGEIQTERITDAERGSLRFITDIGVAFNKPVGSIEGPK